MADSLQPNFVIVIIKAKIADTQRLKNVAKLLRFYSPFQTRRTGLQFFKEDAAEA